MKNLAFSTAVRVAAGCACLFAALLPAFAVDTKTWIQDDMASFDKGTLTGLSLSSEGKLTLAPASRELLDASAPFLYAVARDSKGNIYTGTGGLGASTAKLFEVDPKGVSKVLAELDGIAIQAIAVDSTDRVYAATSPDGKVYRVSASGKAEVFYDPKCKYIWALTFDRSGNLYVATGDAGEIHKVTPAGAGSVFFKTEESHARSLALDKSGNLIVGTEPSGLIERITLTGAAAGQGFVLYQAPKREIAAVAVAPDGTIYAAGDGNKQASTPAASPAPPSGSVVTPIPAASAVVIAARATALPAPASAPSVAGGSEIYRIQADGYARSIWSDTQDLVYAIAFDARGRAVAGTGNRGYLYRLDSDHSFTRLRSLASMQVTGLTSAPDGTIYAVTGNIGKLFAVGPGLEPSGDYESDVLDAGAFTYWGRVSTLPASSNGVSIETRSGNLDRPQQNWSPWVKLNAGRIASPPARFLEYKARLTGANAAVEIERVEIAYQMKNVAPVIEELEITPPNYRFPAPASGAAPSGSPASLSLPQIGRRASNSGGSASSSASTPSLTWAKGFIGARWLAEDDNGDTLLYTAEIRGVNETGWKLIRDKIRENYVSWDSTAFPDGKYVVRVTASDSPSNPPDQALSASRESEPFLIDNTPPEITGLTAAPSGAKVEIRFHAADALSNLAKAEYSINGGDWMVVEPTTRLTDSTAHDYRAEINRGSIEHGGGELTIAVRVSDDFENQAVAKTVLR